MTSIPLVNQQDEQHSLAKLKHFYDQGLIPPEKKGYLTDLRHSVGPYMAVESADGESHFILDAASQIATLGLGFNPGSFFGCAHFLESWLNDRWSPEALKVRKAFDDFLNRKLGWENIYTTYVNSGAEANEVALGYCYKFRAHTEAQKVLAFEGSFHGRMMVSLSATWNADKRVPFEWPTKETIYAPYPGLETDQIEQSMPKYWREVWDQATLANFSMPKAWKIENDPLLEKEIKSLLFVREQLLAKKLFAVLIEPMQCEGGDCYASDRFHTALLLMARSFQVPVVYDEVQTGFHLGTEFFWHKQFNLKDLNGSQLSPSYVVCAKKAQIGFVATHCDVTSPQYESFQVSSMVRGYHHGLALDQAQDRIIALEKRARVHLKKWQQKFPEHLKNARARGLSFAIDLVDSKHVTSFINTRFAHGLLYYPAGSHTLRFRLNTSFFEQDLEFLFNELHQISSEIFLGQELKLPKLAPERVDQSADLYEWQSLILKTRLKLARGEKITSMEMLNKISLMMAKRWGAELVTITAQNFEAYRGAILEIQRKNYEPTRQTSINKFFDAAKHPKGLALGLVKKGVLEGIIFAAPLKVFELERGVRNDPYFLDENVLYMLDATVNEENRGLGLGRFLKYALTLYAMVKGVKRLHGRNRDRLAASMMAINFSLGAYELQYIPEDYPDFEDFRDVFYYTTPLDWKEAPLRLGHGIDCPLSVEDLDDEFMSEQLPLINNKVCLSNFVSERFLKHMESLSKALPQNLRHLYSVSGQSEAVDKVAKSLWYNSDKTSYHMVSFDNHEFGRGSFVSRALGDRQADYFPVTHFPNPTMDNFTEVLEQLEGFLSENKVLAVWIEPLLQKTMQRVPLAFLMALKELCAHYKTSLVYNETASCFYRYSNEHFFLSNDPALTPDAGLCFTGGQSGVVFVSKEKFVEKPLMLISTWDGDEFAFANFVRAYELVQKNLSVFQADLKDFQEKLEKLFSQHKNAEIELENGVGFIQGALPEKYTHLFKKNGAGILVCPSWGEIRRFQKSYSEMLSKNNWEA